MKPSSSASRAQKLPQITSRTLTTVRCKQSSLEHSMPVQGTVDSLLSIPGFPEHSASFQNNVGHSSHMVESQDTSPSVQKTIGPLPPLSGHTGPSQYDPGSWESSLEVSRDLAHLLSTKLYISAQATLVLSPYTQESLQQSSSALKNQGTSESDQCTHKHLSSVSGSLGMSPCVSRTTGTLPHAPKPCGHSSPTQASPAPPPSLQKTVTNFPYSQATLYRAIWNVARVHLCHLAGQEYPMLHQEVWKFQHLLQ